MLTGDIAVTTVAVDLAAQRGILVLTAAGNDGPGARTLVTPADADSGLAIGAEDSLGTIAAFSSRGPTADGRIKPDFTAPGAEVCVLTDANTVRRLSGTSFATPLAAAAAALVKQLHPGLGPIALRDALRAHATNRTRPDTVRGWGRPDAAASATFPAGIAPLGPVGPVLGSVTPSFVWGSGGVPGFATPVSFRVRVARDSGLITPLVDIALTAIQRYDLGRALKPGALFWRVDATAATGVTATSGLVGPLTVPPWATLTSLSDPAGVSTSELQPTFTWTSPAIASPPGPFRYDLFVHRLSAPGAVEFAAAGLTDTSFRLPQPLERNTAYAWSLVVHAGSDTSLVRSQGAFLVLDPSIPRATLLYQNFPNPFPTASRDSTCLWFDLAAGGPVELVILDLRGRPVRRFIPGPGFPSYLAPGRYGRGAAGGPSCDPSLMWDGRTDDGRDLPAGVYLYKFKAPGVILFKRIVFRGRKP